MKPFKISISGEKQVKSSEISTEIGVLSVNKFIKHVEYGLKG